MNADAPFKWILKSYFIGTITMQLAYYDAAYYDCNYVCICLKNKKKNIQAIFKNTANK